MKKACFIVPYFGKFPNYFELFLKSIKNNNSYDWIFFTDDVDYAFPANSKVFYMEFAEMQRIIQSKFDFKIALDTPYKICDFRCAYGFVFQEYLSEYKYWGYCDIDLIFGCLDNFIMSEDFDSYDKIGHLGHFSLYRNCKEINEIFFSDDSYKTVFSNPNNFIFDEWNENSINRILLRYNKTINYLNSWADIYPFSNYFQLVELNFQTNNYDVKKEINLFEWNNGHILSVLKDDKMGHEYMYLHLQKRQMKISGLLSGDFSLFYCVPDMFLSEQEWDHRKYYRQSLSKKLLNTKKIRFNIRKFKYSLKEKAAKLLND